jgi:large subunit ribosomal protein L32
MLDFMVSSGILGPSSVRPLVSIYGVTMPTPKKRTTRSKRDMRRSHDFAVPKTTNKCANCGSLKLPHTVCSSCGYYKGEEVVVAKN